MPRRTKPTAESPASSDTPGDARRLAELIDLQHQLLLGFATGAIDMAVASGAFGEAQEEIRAICGRLGAIRPPFPWGSLEAWKWEAKGFADAADIDARLGQYRSQVDAAIAALTGEPPWTLYPFADDQASFSRDLADLDAPKLDALQVALEEVLAIHGNALIGTEWMHKVVDGDGVYEFRVDNDEDQIRARTGSTTRAALTISRSIGGIGLRLVNIEQLADDVERRGATRTGVHDEEPDEFSSSCLERGRSGSEAPDSPRPPRR